MSAMRHLTFTDGIYALAAIGGAAVVACGLGVTALVAGRFVEELTRSRNEKRVRAMGGAL